jgi:hypothetical protein
VSDDHIRNAFKAKHLYGPVPPPYPGVREDLHRLTYWQEVDPDRVVLRPDAVPTKRTYVVCSGCDYRWKKFPGSGPVAPVPVSRLDPVCQGCEKVCTSSRIDARYCSNACRQRAYRARQRAE